jgi:hypothetical protein
MKRWRENKDHNRPQGLILERMEKKEKEGSAFSNKFSKS